MKLEVPVKVDIDDVTKLIHDLQCLQTYKLGVNDTTVLVSLDAVAGVFADHIRAKGFDKDTNVPTNSASDHIHNVVRDDAYRRGYEQGNADANRPEIPDSWIPCSERLPEEGQEILATTVPNGWYDVVIIRTYYAMIHKSVIAWMPLPEPWKGEK